MTTDTAPTHDPVTAIDRLLDIAGFDLESPELRAKLDEFARKAAEVADLPIGLVSIVLDSAQYLAGSHGVAGWIAEAGGTPVEWSFCANVVRTAGTYVVSDASADPAHADNPLVAVDGIRSYAGAPLVSPDGHVLGACCAVGAAPHEFTPAELERLHDLATDVVRELSNHKIT